MAERPAMPEHKDPAEAIEAAAEAIEVLVEGDKKADNNTPSVGPFSDHKIRSLAALILAATSLLATLGTFLKTCDHTVTQNAYTQTENDIQKLNDEQAKTREDIVAIRGYLDGLAHAPITPVVVPGIGVDAGTAPSAVPSLRPLVRPPTTADAGSITFAIISAPPVPSIHPPPPPFQQKAWPDVLGGK
jgi:hypothetical protein